MQSIPPIKRAWWREASVYQIYPASFKDSNGDGLGDIPGIISELEYIKKLGVDIVWLSPVLQSPQVDMGYDVSDYKKIYPPYGTMADHDALIKGLHDRGMKYVMDLVVNHTSDQHPWFKASRSSKTSSYRDWYIWRPARRHAQTGERMPPNNWESFFSRSAWTWDETTQEYYLHLWASGQPDLNWENPQVVEAVHDVIRFWLNRGVDGFRMDVINYISKEPGLPNAKVRKPGFVQKAAEHFSCGPRLHEYLQDIGKILKEYDAFSVGEMPDAEPEDILKAVGQERGELAMAFQFEIDSIDVGPSGRFEQGTFSPTVLKKIVNKWQTFMLSNSGWNALFMENHDMGRTVSRYASDTPALRTLSAKMLANHLAFQSGTVFLYQGQELAMANLPREWGMDKYKDIECLNHWETVLENYPGDLLKQQMYRERYRLVGRDNTRTPMQWNSQYPHAGFMPTNSDNTVPWMPIHPDYPAWNVANAVADPGSSFHHWRKALKLRKHHMDIFVYGVFEMLNIDVEENVIAYIRAVTEPSQALIVASFSAEEIWWKIPQRARHFLLDLSTDTTICNSNAIVSELGNYASRNDIRLVGGRWEKIRLRPYETLVAMV
ncbi:glycoside hydrolase family 13 protein [Talaromyces proteolyticus]|uniref:Glycoside hydrolase family 13 protein n=1 Tax=Talaromyces proteolyticus TaxID=1131652 RepID=A0AAD4KDC1_9EURO|nr:glycoside hydrolase family 13 protein [Talaromyces proteolyticus]KAH8689436.1 glycoside hydrolase family 13 protein [Talaromyces proteolyticus]